MSGNNNDLPPEVEQRIKELRALIKHYINPNAKSKATFDKEYGQLTPEHMMEMMAELMGLEGQLPEDWEGLLESHEENLKNIMDQADSLELQAALNRYAQRMSTAEIIRQSHPEAAELIEKIKQERQSFISKMISASQESDDESEGEDDESEDSQESDDSDSDDDGDDSDEDGDGDPDESDQDGEDGSESDDSDNSQDSDSKNDSDSQSQDPSDSQDQSKEPSDQQSDDASQDNQAQEDQSQDDSSDGDPEDGDPDDGEIEEMDPESYADDMADNADSQPQEEGEEEGDDGDGDGEGDDEGEGDDSEGDGEGDDGDDGDDGDSPGDPGESDGDDDDGFSYGFEQPETPPPGTFQISNEEPDPIAVSKLMQSLQALIARDPEEPTQAPRWNMDKLVRLMLEPGADLTRAKEPTQIPQDVVFIFDNSGSMNEFEQAARRLAQAVGKAADLGSSHVVSIVTSNGEFSQHVSTVDAMGEKDPFHPSSRTNDSGGWFINGEFKGLLPFDPGIYNRDDHCARWEWFLKKELPRKYNITPKVVLYFSDEHGSIQWCYMSQRLKEMEHIWLDPKIRQLPDGSTMSGATKWPRGLFPENMQGMTNDAMYDKSSGYEELFCKFKGIYFSNVGGDTSNEYSTEDDVCNALKQVAGL